MASQKSSNSSPAENYSPDVPNSPELGSNGKPRVRAIKDEEQLAELVKKFEQENRERNTKNARIMAKYNAEKPHRQKELEAEGLGWMSNFSSQPLSTLIDRVAPRFARAVHAARYLTSAELPDHVEGAAFKTETFRKHFTKLVRNRPEWKDLVAEVAQENSLFGYTAVCHLDEFEWFPQHFRQDEFFVPAATKQNSKHCQILILKETFQPHELFEKIEDQKAADEAGWYVEQVIESINKAMPETISKNFNDSARVYEDLKRESNLYSSLANGAKVVIAYHALVMEVTGKVSHYILDGKCFKYLFERQDRFESMSDVATFFSFQQANGKLQASKGVGRTVYALAGIVDRSRNEVVNRLQLSGKMIVRGDEKTLRSFRMNVVGQAIVISKAFEVVQHKIEAGVEAFMSLDGYVQRMMDEIAGNVSPAAAAETLQGERVTNGQINFIADLQNEGKDAKIERFLVQMASLLSQMQRRAANPNVQDADAQQFRGQCLSVMSEEELQALANHPAAGTVEDFTDQQRQRVIMAVTEHIQDPMINKKEALYRKISAMVDPDFAKAIMLDDEDPTIAAEQTRLQAIENFLILNGRAELAQVSPRDNHIVHLDVLLKEAEQVASTVAQDVSAVELLQAFVEHATAHIQLAGQQGGEGQLQPYVDAVSKIQQGIQTVAQAAQQQVAAQEAVSAEPALA